ncbi:diiron oxygenase [Leptolyngbyaceae cyanobacterium CCMR0081]|uniref:Diiron oxygenase n=2 Tax=Adonisia TaxID=2950183 RepID=A0A6M0RQR6_9CYAN|nr:diiron oxygenase [Adonisia turfae CCMR0081]
MNSVIEPSKTQTVKPDSSADISHSRMLLEKMAHNWHLRSQVSQVKKKVAYESSSEMAFNPNREDFRLDLLPFKDHPDFLAAPSEIRQKVLSCGWIAYNEKTIDIESKVIAPACNHILYREVPGVDDETSQLIASDTLVDEAYHIQLVVHACNITREHRQLQHLKLPSFTLVRKMTQEKERYSEPWKKLLVQMATAIVSEVFVSDYLSLLAYDKEIQPLNQLTVYTHLRDEKAHHSIFLELAKCMYANLSLEQQMFFSQILPKPVRWFADAELDVWGAMLQQINFPNARTIIQDTATNADVDLLRIDYSDVIQLAKELGVLDSVAGADSFAQAGLCD